MNHLSNFTCVYIKITLVYPIANCFVDKLHKKISNNHVKYLKQLCPRLFFTQLFVAVQNDKQDVTIIIIIFRITNASCSLDIR